MTLQKSYGMGHLENTGISFRYGAGGSWNLFPRIVVGPNEQAYHIKILLADRGPNLNWMSVVRL